MGFHRTGRRTERSCGPGSHDADPGQRPDAAGSGEQETDVVPDDAVHGARGAVLAGWPVHGVLVERVGQREVYVEPIPRDGRRWQVSNDYGREPRWRGDGREMFYLGREDRPTAVAVEATASGLGFDRPRRSSSCASAAPTCAITTRSRLDGQRFLVNTVVEDVPGTPINVWMDWLAGVSRGTDD